MSEIINNREHRQKVLKELILELHAGKSVEEVKARFEKLIEGVTATEISQMEQALILEGLPIEEVQRLCDVHAAVFKGAIQDIHKSQGPTELPGHPVHTLLLENRALERVMDLEILRALKDLQAGSAGSLEMLQKAFQRLWQIDKHYSRKENLIFPYMERYDITGPPKVMWGVDDEIRRDIKKVMGLLETESPDMYSVTEAAEQAMHKVREMIFKEENIMIPMVLETFTEDEWLRIAEESDQIGYCLVHPAGKWQPERVDVERKTPAIPTAPEAGIRFETGVLQKLELESMLNHLPVDITFIDREDVVKYFSHGKDRIFERTKAVIGRTVQNCHPPASVHVVEKMLQDFKSGRKDREDFWIRMGPRYVYIRYFAVRDPKGDYLGTLEFTQDIKPIQQIQDEKRLLSE